MQQRLPKPVYPLQPRAHKSMKAPQNRVTRTAASVKPRVATHQSTKPVARPNANEPKTDQRKHRMKIAVLFGWQTGVFFQGDALVNLCREGASRGHHVYFLHVNDPLVTLKMIADFDWIICTLHGENPHLCNFISAIPDKIKVAAFQHDLFVTVEDIAYSLTRKPDLIFYELKEWTKSSIPALADVRRVPIPPIKTDIDSMVCVTRKNRKITLVEEFEAQGGPSQNPRLANSSILCRPPLEDIAAYLRKHDFDVSIKSYYTMHEYIGVECDYHGSFGAVRAFKESAFMVGSMSGLLAEAPAFGCVPLVIQNVKNITLQPDAQYNTPINTIYKEPYAYYRVRQGPFQLPFTWIPTITQEEKTDNILEKIRQINADRPNIVDRLRDRFVTSTLPVSACIMNALETHR